MKFILNPNDWLARHPRLNLALIFVLFVLVSSIDGRLQ